MPGHCVLTHRIDRLQAFDEERAKEDAAQQAAATAAAEQQLSSVGQKLGHNQMSEAATRASVRGHQRSVRESTMWGSRSASSDISPIPFHGTQSLSQDDPILATPGSVSTAAVKKRAHRGGIRASLGSSNSGGLQGTDDSYYPRDAFRETTMATVPMPHCYMLRPYCPCQDDDKDSRDNEAQDEVTRATKNIACLVPVKLSAGYQAGCVCRNWIGRST